MSWCVSWQLVCELVCDLACSLVRLVACVEGYSAFVGVVFDEVLVDVADVYAGMDLAVCSAVCCRTLVW